MDEPVEPTITSIRSEGQVTRHYGLSLRHSAGTRDQVIQANVYRYVRRNCRVSDGTERTFTEEDDPLEPFYTLQIDTGLGFAEALAVFREIGVTNRAKIPLLSYGNNLVENVGNDFLGKLDKMARGEEQIEFASRSGYQAGKPNETVRYHRTPFIVADLDAPFIKDISGTEGLVFIRIDCEKGPGASGATFTYQKEQTPKGIVQTIGYMDSQIVEPRFRRILETASFRLNDKEIELLEIMITKALLL